MVLNAAYTPSYDWEIDCDCNAKHEVDCKKPSIKNVKGLPISTGVGISAGYVSASVGTSHSLELTVSGIHTHNCPVHPGDKETVGNWAEIDLTVTWMVTGSAGVGVAGVNSSGSAGAGSDTSQKSGSNTSKTHTVKVVCCVCPPAPAPPSKSSGDGPNTPSGGATGPKPKGDKDPADMNPPGSMIDVIPPDLWKNEQRQNQKPNK